LAEIESGAMGFIIVQQTNLREPTGYKTARWIVLLFALQVGIVNGLGENVITTSGFLDVTMFDGSKPVPQESSSNEFRASVSSDGRWTLEVRPIYKKGDILYGKKDVMYQSFNGTDTYFCQYSEAVEGITNGRPGIIGTKPISDRSQLSYISAGNYPFSPFDAQKRTHILWLVYGAGKYIHDTKAGSLPLPWLSARNNLFSYGFRLKAELSPDSPYIPTTLQFIRDSQLDLQNENSEYSRPELDQPLNNEMFAILQDALKERKTIWHDGAIAGKLETGTFTNLYGFNVPLSFEFRTFTELGVLRRLFVATVTNVTGENADEKSAQETFHPPVLVNRTVLDTRFRLRDSSRNIDSISYGLNEGEPWLSKDSDALQKRFKEYLNNPKLSARNRFSISSERTKRFWIVGLFLMSTISLLLLLFRFPRNHPKINH
jgi:hypothetical protein